MTGYSIRAGRLWTILHTVPILHSLDSLRSTWQARNLHQTLPRNKLSSPNYRYWAHDFFRIWQQALVPPWEKCLNVSVDTWMSDTYLMLPKCHVYNEVRMKFLASVCLLAYFLKLRLTWSSLWQWSLTLRSSTPFFLPEWRHLFSCCSFSTTLFIATIVLSSSATDFSDLYWEWCCTTLYHTYPHQTQKNQKLSSIPLNYTECDNYTSCPSHLHYIKYNKQKAFFFHFISLSPNFLFRILFSCTHSEVLQPHKTGNTIASFSLPGCHVVWW